jgi:MFS transporter, DHA2 family, multidrug resistance protein
MIISFALLSAFCLLALIPWELSRKDPIVDISLLGRRQFGACFLVMLGTGAILIATTQMLPQFLQTELNYTATLTGLAFSPGGIITMIMMPVVGRLVGIVQPKYLIVVGASIVALTDVASDLADGRYHLWLCGMVSHHAGLRAAVPVSSSDDRVL